MDNISQMAKSQMDVFLDRENPKHQTNSKMFPMKEVEYKVLSNPNKISQIVSTGAFAYNQQHLPPYVPSKRNILKSSINSAEIYNRTICSNKRSRQPFSKDLFLVNEPISENIELNIEKTKQKCYIKGDLLEKLYFCPNNNVVILDYNDTNKIGTLLLDYIRMEGEYERQKIEKERLIQEWKQNIEELIKKSNEEKEKLTNELNLIKELNIKKKEAVEKYMLALKRRIDMCNKFFNEEDYNLIEFDNSKNIDVK
jgi:hypothetical protein